MEERTIIWVRTIEKDVNNNNNVNNVNNLLFHPHHTSDESALPKVATFTTAALVHLSIGPDESRRMREAQPGSQERQ